MHVVSDTDTNYSSSLPLSSVVSIASVTVAFISRD